MRNDWIRDIIWVWLIINIMSEIFNTSVLNKFLLQNKLMGVELKFTKFINIL